jgi:3-phenylpropionate/trans-cinnamate dioxygenase ferredoxin reductase component
VAAIPHVIIVGAGIAGVQAAESLRAAGFDGKLTVTDADHELPYDRPPLSKEFLNGALDAEDLRIWSVDRVGELEIDLQLGTRAIGLDTDRKRLTTRRTDREVEEIAYDHLVLAVGVTARRLPGVGDLAGVHTLRTLTDARDLRSALRSTSGPVVVVGGGFIGGEVACTAAMAGLDVTVIEAGQHLLPNVLTADLARPLENLHNKAGVRLIRGTGVTGIAGTDSVNGVELSNGERLAADLVVVGLGGTPAVDWLVGSTIKLDNGIHVDEHLRTSAVDVYAVGDAACSPGGLSNSPVRIEHWSSAKHQGTQVASSLLGGASPFRDVPYIWTDQHGSRLQIAGITHGDEVRFIDGSADESAYLALVRRGNDLAGVIALDRAREFNRLRALLRSTPRWESVVRSGSLPPSTGGFTCVS